MWNYLLYKVSVREKEIVSNMECRVLFTWSLRAEIQGNDSLFFHREGRCCHLPGIPISSLNCFKPYIFKVEAKKIIQAIL